MYFILILHMLSSNVEETQSAILLFEQDKIMGPRVVILKFSLCTGYSRDGVVLEIAAIMQKAKCWMIGLSL